MALNRYLYAASLGLSLLSYLAWGQWLAWIVLLFLLVFPWLSLGLSIPAIIRFRAEPSCPRRILAGSWAELSLLGSCPYPVPPFRGRLRVHNLLTGEQRLYRPETGISTRHCGGCRVTVEKGRVCDYLGLFAFPIRCQGSSLYLVLPHPLVVDPLPEFLKQPVTAFDPEETALRPYQPGDPLRRIHRKLSIKTDSLILHSPTHRHSPVVLPLELTGNAAALDRILGEFVWLGKKLTENTIPFVVQVHTPNGLLRLPVGNDRELDRVLCRLLCTPCEGGHRG